MPLGMEIGLGPGDFVLDGGGGALSPTQFSPTSIVWPNGCMDQDATWYGDRPRPRRLCVRWGPRSPSPKGDGAPKFSDHVYCDQTAGWMKLVLGMEVGLNPGDFVLDGDPASPPPKGGGALYPIFAHFYCGQTAGCIKMPLGMDAGISPGDFVLDGDPVPLPKRGEPPNFRPVSIVAKRPDGSRWQLAWRWALVQATLY